MTDSLATAPAESELLRPHAEQLFADELAALAAADDRPRPPSWLLSPNAVVTYVLGGELPDGTVITPKYVGPRRLVEVAVATLATDRALLLLGLPGTAKTWVSEHLAAAISGTRPCSSRAPRAPRRSRSATAGTTPACSPRARPRPPSSPSPVLTAMREGKIARIEELTRIPSDVQDALITILSEKTLPVPELGTEVQAAKGFSVIATANDRDRGVNDLSSALRRRFNTVVLPLPATEDEEVEIVARRVADLGRALELPDVPAAADEIRRVVRVFRELRSGVTEDGRTKVKSPVGHAVDGRGDLRRHQRARAGRPLRRRRAGRVRRGRRHPRRGRQGPGRRPRRLDRVPRGRRPRAARVVGLLPRLPRGERVTAAVVEAVATEVSDGTYVLGIRHHGPGSARGVLAELDRIGPDVVLVEGPADADSLVRFVAAEGMEPPVALLAYDATTPARAVFWPYAVFSPEWQALRWAVDRGALARFVDLPSGAVLAHRPAAPRDEREEPDEPHTDTDVETVVRSDPIALLAAAAGYDDPERWWDDVIESRSDGAGFEAITEAMASLREEPDSRHTHRDEHHEARREAYMRTVLREVRKGGARRIVVVCGAWHAPALTDPLPTAAADARVLKGMPKAKTVMTWVPWTHSRLSYASGYGAGIESPGWYHHLFTTADHVVPRWLTKVAGRLREKDLPVSSAHVIEAVRLAEAVATMRGRPLAGLAEVTDATRSVLCQGEELLVELVTRDVVVGERLGTVPEEAPTVPLEADLRATARRLRLAMDPLEKALELDLRKPNDLARSRLLHRLRVLDIDWGAPARTAGTGTFKEGWSLAWRPELSVDVAVSSVWGTSVVDAATARVVDRATSRDSSLATVTRAMEACLLGDLVAALPRVLASLRDRAALDVDVEHLMEALPVLVRAMRYGDVRSTDTAALGEVGASLLVRIEAALPAAVTGLGDEAAEALRDHVEEVHAATALMSAEQRAEWLVTLERLTRRADLHGLLAGRFVRLLADAQVFDSEDTARRLQRALSVGSTPAEKAAWIEGFLAGGGLLLVHDTALLGTLDAWLAGLRPEEFVDVLPLLRRTFGGFQTAERRQLAHQLRRLDGAGSVTAARAATEWSDADLARATPAVATVARLLGLPFPSGDGS